MKLCFCGNVIFCKDKCKSCYSKEYKILHKKDISEYNKQYATDNKQKINTNRKHRYKNNSEKILKAQKIAYDKAPNKFKTRNAKWRENNLEYKLQLDKVYRDTHREQISQSKINWKNNNRDKVRHSTAKHRAIKLQATPKWLTEQHYEQIKIFYKEAFKLSKETNQEYHVDHIVPLQGRNVSGLHVHWNLQVLPKVENLKKGNKYENRDQKC